MQTEHLEITGMTCGGCTSKVARALKTLPGVGDVTVSLADGDATVQYDERQSTPDQLKSAVTNAGYGVNGAKSAHRHQSKGGCCD